MACSSLRVKISKRYMAVILQWSTLQKALGKVVLQMVVIVTHDKRLIPTLWLSYS